MATTMSVLQISQMIIFSRRTAFFIALAAIFWGAQLFLDFEYIISGQTYQIPYSKYLFVGSTVIGGVIFVFMKEFKGSTKCLLKYNLKWFFLIFVVSVLISSGDYRSVRTFFVFSLITACSVYAGLYVFLQNERDQNISLLILSIPSILVVILGAILRVFGPLDIGFKLAIEQHAGYEPVRWFFLHSSANGFGLDCALVSILGLVLIVNTRKPVTRLMGFLAVTIGVWALAGSGTRIAIVMLVVSACTLLIVSCKRRKYSSRTALLVLLISLSGTGLFIGFWGQSLWAFFRLDGPLNEISSGRFNGIISALNAIRHHLLHGVGFGLGDELLKFTPRNLFYFIMPLEIGLVGSVSAFIIMLYPAYQFFSKAAVSAPNGIQSHYSLSLMMFCLLIFVSIPFRLLAEFDVFRISATNQLFFFCWSYLLASVQNVKSILSTQEV